jgi:predicted outer membrane repeat protein
LGRHLGIPFRMLGGSSAAAAGPTTLILDNFTDANSTALTSHTIAPTNTPATSWSALELTYEIQSNRAQNSGGAIASTYCDSAAADGTITSIVRRSGAVDCALAFRITDANNYWLADLQAAGAFKLFNKAAGSYNEIATTAVTFTDATDYTIKVILNGTSIKAYVNDANELTTTSAVRQTETKHGLWKAGAGGAGIFDDFTVTNATS